MNENQAGDGSLFTREEVLADVRASWCRGVAHGILADEMRRNPTVDLATLTQRAIDAAKLIYSSF